MKIQDDYPIDNTLNLRSNATKGVIVKSVEELKRLEGRLRGDLRESCAMIKDCLLLGGSVLTLYRPWSLRAK